MAALLAKGGAITAPPFAYGARTRLYIKIYCIIFYYVIQIYRVMCILYNRVIFMALNERVIGKKYAAPPIEVARHESIYYALAINEDNDAYFDMRRPGGILVPPMYAVMYSAVPTANIVFDQEVGLNMMMVVHYSQEFEWLKPVRPGDSISTEGVITHITVKEKGAILGWQIEGKNQHGDIVVRSRWEFFDRSAGSGKPDVKISNPVSPSAIEWTDSMRVRNGQSYIYAEPSMDQSPLHVDDEFAKNVGLPGVILQGLCTMAFAHKAVVDNCTGPSRDPMRVKRLHVQFARPVLPGQTITFQGYIVGNDGPDVRYGIIARNEEGKDVLRDAWCAVERE